MGKLTDTDMVEMVTEASEVTRALEALCRVWRQSRSDHLPHICNTLHSIVIHLNDTSLSEYSGHWSPVTQLYDTSFYSARNLVISASLLVVFTLLLAVATFLATKYGRKAVLSMTSAPEYELETLTGKRDWALEEPPEYTTVMVTKDDTQPPDYFDDIVYKVQI